MKISPHLPKYVEETMSHQYEESVSRYTDMKDEVPTAKAIITAEDALARLADITLARAQRYLQESRSQTDPEDARNDLQDAILTLNIAVDIFTLILASRP